MPHCIYCHSSEGLVHTDLGPVCTGPECSDRLDSDLFQLDMSLQTAEEIPGEKAADSKTV
jgi:hypothetical protein